METYLDSSLQKHIDLIQQGSIIGFTDDNQQIGGVVLNNEGTEVIGVIGGRNYAGKKVFNRGFHLKRNPASTIKPVLSYALGMEYLGLHPLSTVKDVLTPIRERIRKSITPIRNIWAISRSSKHWAIPETPAP